MSKRENNARVEHAFVSAIREGHKFAGNWARLPCPFCEDDGHRDRKTSLGIELKSGKWHCFRCENEGRLKGRDRDKEHEEIWKHPNKERKDNVFTPVDPPEGFTKLSSKNGRDSLTLRPARDYMRSRGVPKETWKAAHIGACAEGWWAGRIIVPHIVPSISDQWVGFIGRLWVPKPNPKAEGRYAKPYLYPKGMNRGQWMYNHDAISEDTDEPLICVEGAFDCFPFWPNAAAFLGKPSAEQVSALLDAKRPLAIVLDGDAWESGRDLASLLRFEKKMAGHVKLPGKKDPDEMVEFVKEEAYKCLKQKI